MTPLMDERFSPIISQDEEGEEGDEILPDEAEDDGDELETGGSEPETESTDATDEM